MPANTQALTQLADNTAREIIGSYQRWTASLLSERILYESEFDSKTKSVQRG